MDNTTDQITFSVTDIARIVARTANANRWCSEVYGYTSAISDTMGANIAVTRRQAAYAVNVTLEVGLIISLPTESWVAVADLKSETPDERTLATTYDGTIRNAIRFALQDYVNDTGAYGVANNVNILSWEADEYIAPQYVAEEYAD